MGPSLPNMTGSLSAEAAQCQKQCQASHALLGSAMAFQQCQKQCQWTNIKPLAPSQAPSQAPSSCVKAPDQIYDGQTCCHDAMPYHTAVGSFCRFPWAAANAAAVETLAADPSLPNMTGSLSTEAAQEQEKQCQKQCLASHAILGSTMAFQQCQKQCQWTNIKPLAPSQAPPTSACQAEAKPCTESLHCCNGLTCQHLGGGWDMQCATPYPPPPPCQAEAKPCTDS